MHGWLHVFKKLGDRPLVAAVKPRSLFVTDALTGRKFLLDTGASVSLFPAAPNSDPDNSAIQLVAANGTRINTFGTKKIPLMFDGRRFQWEFTLANVREPLLGADFLGHYNLLVDVAHSRLVDVSTFHTHFLSESVSTVSSVVTSSASNFDSILDEFPDVFRPELKPFDPNEPPAHGVYHHMEVSGPPIYSRYRRLSPEKLKIAKASFDEMEALGICRRSNSSWNSPLHMVPKSKPGEWRPCGDYRRLNLRTVADRYPPPNIEDLSTRLAGATVFSKVDLLKGYFQIPMHPDDVKYTAIVTPFGTFEFLRLPFGLRNAGSSFQRMMDRVFSSLTCVFVYMDDILVFSPDIEQHKRDLRLVLEALKSNGLVVRRDKCEIGKKSITFLGHTVNASGILPNTEKTKAVSDFPVPSSVSELQSFLGAVNFYHRFIPGLATIMRPLYSVLSGKPKTLTWGPEQALAFSAVKDALSNATLLAHPVSSAPVILRTDASDVAVGAVLEQLVNGIHQPLAFFSKKLRPPETQYSTFDRELLAIYLALRKFRHHLEGKQFTIYTDHKPLTFALSRKTDPWSARQQRHLSAIAEFNCVLVHSSGTDNVVADALSRAPVDAVQVSVSFSDLAEAQEEASDEMKAYSSANSGLVCAKVKLDNHFLLCDVSTGRPRPIIPTSYCRSVFEAIHNLAHPSPKATIKLVTGRFVWHNVRRNVREWAKSCLTCQSAKVCRHTESGIAVFESIPQRLGHCHVDLVGPLPPSNGHRYLLTVVERSTRWPEVFPLVDSTAVSCASAFLHGWVARFGVPRLITSDRGPQFTSALWNNISSLMGSKLRPTVAYNPACNGIVERFHRSLKAALMARLAGSDWFHHLPWVLLGLRSVPKEGVDISAAELLYGQPLVLPGEFFPQTPQTQRQVTFRAYVNVLITTYPSGHHLILAVKSMFRMQYGRQRMYSSV